MYLYKAAQELLFHGFYNKNDFTILIPQYQTCAERKNCSFYEEKRCITKNEFLYNLKEHGYINCNKLSLDQIPCVSIEQEDRKDTAIIICPSQSINMEEAEFDRYRKSRIIQIGVNSELQQLLEGPIGGKYASFFNFKPNHVKEVPRSEMNNTILKFSLYSNGKYYVNRISCERINDKKKTTIYEIVYLNCDIYYDNAVLYSLLTCYKSKLKACYCRLCFFLAYSQYDTICKRYRTKGTPHYPLEVMHTNCPHFSINKALVDELEKELQDERYIEIHPEQHILPLGTQQL